MGLGWLERKTSFNNNCIVDDQNVICHYNLKNTRSNQRWTLKVATGTLSEEWGTFFSSLSLFLSSWETLMLSYLTPLFVSSIKTLIFAQELLLNQVIHDDWEVKDALSTAISLVFVQGVVQSMVIIPDICHFFYKDKIFGSKNLHRKMCSLWQMNFTTK